MRRLIEAGPLQSLMGKNAHRNLRLHRVAADVELRELTSSSKFNTEWSFFLHLRDIGRAAADRFLSEHLNAIGRRSSLDFRKEVA